MASQLCDSGIGADLQNLFPDKYSDRSIIDTINDLQHSLDDTTAFCRFLDEWVNCSEILSPIISEKGLCYSFNTLHMYDYGTNA